MIELQDSSFSITIHLLFKEPQQNTAPAHSSTDTIQYPHLISFTGQLYSTVSLEFEDRGHSLRDFALVTVDGERKKLMLRDERNTIYVFELIYEP